MSRFRNDCGCGYNWEAHKSQRSFSTYKIDIEGLPAVCLLLSSPNAIQVKLQ